MSYTAPGYGMGDPEFITPRSQISSIGDMTRHFTDVNGLGGAAAWPANNLALYIAFMVMSPFTVKKMSVWCGTASGTMDFGIYDASFARLVSLGPTTITTGTFVGDLTDTVISRGLYYMAALGSTTAMTIRRDTMANTTYQGCGMFQEAVGSATLPVTATPVAPAQSFMPNSLVVSGRTQV